MLNYFLLSLVFINSSLALAEKTRRYGVVDMQRVILSVDEGKQARQKLEKQIKAKEKLLRKSKQELDTLNKEWQSQAPLLNESAKIKKQQQFQEKFVSLRNKEMEFQAEIKRKEQQATKDIAVKIARLVEQMAVKMKLEVVFESSSGLLYVKEPLDLTDKVIDNYNRTHKPTK